ncbi:hypothetical protein GH733_007298 [Mirounga leonina]|nr:hypothetical protein GH733_007298 [Mirounga leonina]
MEILALLSLTFALSGLVGNLIVLWILGFRMQRNTFSVYILNLAGADFLFLSFQVVYSLKALVNFHSVPLSIPSTEHCLSVLCPIWYRCHRPRHTSTGMCALLWALSLLLSILEGKYCGLLLRDFEDGDQAVRNRGAHSAGLPPLRPDLRHSLVLLRWIRTSSDTVLGHLNLAPIVLSCINSFVNPIIYLFVGSCRQRWPQRHKSLKMVLQRALQDISGGVRVKPAFLRELWRWQEAVWCPESGKCGFESQLSAHQFGRFS